MSFLDVFRRFFADDPMDTASPRDIALLLESLTQHTRTAQDALAEAESREWEPGAAMVLLSEIRDTVTTAKAAERALWVVLRREQQMAQTLDQITALPETGDAR